MQTQKVALVVDADALAGAAARRSLGELGYHVDVCKDANDALMKMAAARPDLLLVDLSLAGMDGATFVQVVRRTPGFEAVPVYGCSAIYAGESGPVKLFRGAGANGFVEKPLEASRLRPALAEDASPAIRWPGKVVRDTSEDLPWSGEFDMPPASGKLAPRSRPGADSAMITRAFSSASTPDFADELLAEADAIADWEDALTVNEARDKAKRRRIKSMTNPGKRVLRPPPKSRPRVWTAPGAAVPETYGSSTPGRAPRKVLDLNRQTGDRSTRRVRRGKAAELDTRTFQGFAGEGELPAVVQWDGLRSNCVVEEANDEQIVLRCLGQVPPRGSRVEIGVRFAPGGKGAPVKLKMTGTVAWIAEKAPHSNLLIALGITGNAEHFAALCKDVGG